MRFQGATRSSSLPCNFPASGFPSGLIARHTATVPSGHARGAAPQARQTPPPAGSGGCRAGVPCDVERGSVGRGRRHDCYRALQALVGCELTPEERSAGNLQLRSVEAQAGDCLRPPGDGERGGMPPPLVRDSTKDYIRCTRLQISENRVARGFVSGSRKFPMQTECAGTMRSPDHLRGPPQLPREERLLLSVD